MNNSADFKSILESVEREMKDAVHAVLGSLDLLGEEKLTAAQCGHVQRGRSSVSHLLRILDDVAMLTTDQAAAADSTPFAPAELLRTIVEVLDPLARRRGLSLELDAESDPILVEADAFVFEQIVTRTLEYAIRSVERGAIALSLHSSAPDGEGKSRIEIAVRSAAWPMPDDHLTVHVARDLASKIGAAFQRFPGEPESRIEISIPVKLLASQLAGSKSSIRILVAEDCDESFQLLAAFLRGQPCSVRRAMDGVQAVAMATSGQHDIAFMDIHMPGLDGYAATQRIRDWETAQCRKRMPIVVLSTEAIESQMREGAVVGCSAYLEKPVRKTTLVGTLNRYAADMAL